MEERKGRAETDERPEGRVPSDKKQFEHFAAQVEGGLASHNPQSSLMNIYKLMFNGANEVNLDMEDVLEAYLEQTRRLAPSSKYPPLTSSSNRIRDIQKFLSSLDKQSVAETAQTFAQLPDQKLYESVASIENLFLKVMIEYNHEIQRSQLLGILKKPKK